jgi:hypothetical protein
MKHFIWIALRLSLMWPHPIQPCGCTIPWLPPLRWVYLPVVISQVDDSARAANLRPTAEPAPRVEPAHHVWLPDIRGCNLVGR